MFLESKELAHLIPCDPTPRTATETNRPAIVLARPKEASKMPNADPVVSQLWTAEAVLD